MNLLARRRAPVVEAVKGRLAQCREKARASKEKRASTSYPDPKSGIKIAKNPFDPDDEIAVTKQAKERLKKKKRSPGEQVTEASERRELEEETTKVRTEAELESRIVEICRTKGRSAETTLEVLRTFRKKGRGAMEVSTDEDLWKWIGLFIGQQNDADAADPELAMFK